MNYEQLDTPYYWTYSEDSSSSLGPETGDPD
jgi:hypothetical protein